MPAGRENLEDSIKIYINQFTNAINGEITYRSPVFLAIGEKREQLIVQLNATPAKDHIRITFLTKDLACSKQGQRISVWMNEDHSTTLVNALSSNCRYMQAAVISKVKASARDFNTDQSEMMFFGFLKIESFRLTDESKSIKYYLDNQSAEKFRMAYKCFEKFTGIWD